MDRDRNQTTSKERVPTDSHTSQGYHPQYGQSSSSADEYKPPASVFIKDEPPNTDIFLASAHLVYLSLTNESLPSSCEDRLKKASRINHSYKVFTLADYKHGLRIFTAYKIREKKHLIAAGLQANEVLFMTSLMLGSKCMEDPENSYSNKSWSLMMSLSLSTLNEAELTILVGLDFQIDFKPEGEIWDYVEDLIQDSTEALLRHTAGQSSGLKL